MATEKKQTYIVIKNGVDQHEIGTEIEFTEAQAAARVHKVQLKKDYKADLKAANTDDAKALKAAEKRIKELEAQAEVDATTIATLKTQVEAAKPAPKAKAPAAGK